MKHSICFIGAGNMGEALIKGCLNSISADNLGFLEANALKADYICKTYNIKRLSSFSEISNYETLIIAIKPQNTPSVIKDLIPTINKDTLLVSIVAGITIDYYQKHFPPLKIIRVMPNTPCLINKGISVICASDNCTENEKNIVGEIFSSTGKVMFMEENKINAVTALSGSGPAYFYHIADTYAKQAQSLGLDYNEALSLITNTMLGSAEMILQSKDSIEDLIAKVRSPGGTTEAALKKLQIEELNIIIKASISAANNRATELSLKE
ncbi:MAG: pyrroline-5-carboxylate reductase [Candidatus Riflemargulisbacteria bacterium]